MHGSQLLRDWLNRRGYQQKEGAEFLGLHETVVSMFVNGKRRPPLETAVHIERLTGIPVASWVSSRRDKSKNARRGQQHSTPELQAVK